MHFEGYYGPTSLTIRMSHMSFLAQQCHLKPKSDSLLLKIKNKNQIRPLRVYLGYGQYEHKGSPVLLR